MTSPELTDERITALIQILNEHGAPTQDERTGFALNFVGRTEDLIRSLERTNARYKNALHRIANMNLSERERYASRMAQAALSPTEEG